MTPALAWVALCLVQTGGDVGKGLAAAGIVATKTASGGAYQAVFEGGGKRRTVYISATASPVSKMRVHQVYTNLRVSRDTPDLKATLVKIKNWKKFGSFVWFKDPEGNFSLRFSAHYDSTRLGSDPKAEDLEVKMLADTVRLVNQVGNETADILAKP